MMYNKTIALILLTTAVSVFAVPFNTINFKQDINTNALDNIGKFNDSVVVTNGTLILKSQDTIIGNKELISNGITFEIGNDGKLNLIFEDDLINKNPMNRIMINNISLKDKVDDQIDSKMIQITPSALSNLVQNMVYNPLWGKKLAIIGDSLTVSPSKEESWGAFIAKRNNMILVNNGRGGERLCVDRTDDKGNVTNVSTIKSYTNDIPKDADFILCQIGTNDTGDWWSSKQGEDTDMTTNTFKGCFNNLIIGLKKNYPNAKIGFILPHLWKTNIGLKTEDQYQTSETRNLSQWEKMQCQRLNIPVIDPVEDTRMFISNYNQYKTNDVIRASNLPNSELNWYEQTRRTIGTSQEVYEDRYGTWHTQSQYLKDTIHTTKQGSLLLSFFYENWMKTVLMCN